jgi:hypothetical protein
MAHEKKRTFMPNAMAACKPSTARMMIFDMGLSD